MNIGKSFTIPARSSCAFELRSGDSVKIIDAEGKQVADLVAICQHNRQEILSMPATIDQNQSIRIFPGNFLYSNLYKSMFEIVEDTVGTHDLIHPMCSPSMFAVQYSEDNCLSCQENITRSLADHDIQLDIDPVPINIFMHSEVETGGKIKIKQPISEKGDYLLMKATQDLIVAVAACSVHQSACNGHRCTSIGIEIL